MHAKTSRPRLPALLTAILLLHTIGLPVHAQQDPPDAQDQPAEQPAANEAQAAEVDDQVERDDRDRSLRRHRQDVIVHFGRDAHLPADAAADAVVAIFGSADAAGEVDEGVVAVFGNARVTGPVRRNAVAVFGDTYVNSRIGENAVAVFGNLELGPDAVVDGDVVAVGGTVTRDPNSRIYGSVEEIAFGPLGRMEWLRTWIEHCLVYARPLAFEPGLGWAWGIALTFLGLYVGITLLFGNAVQRCVDTIEREPGQTIVTSLLAVVLAPVLMLVLIASVIGIVVLPFVGLLLFCAAFFGKAVILAALGRRVTQFTGIGPFGHIAFATLVGGLIVLGLYVVPVFGFILYKVLGILGFGVVAYTALLMMRERRATAAYAPAAPTAQPAGGTMTSAGSYLPPSAGPLGSTAANPVPPATGASPGPVPPSGEHPAAAQPAVPLSALPRAGFWIRMGALLIDVILVAIVVNILDPPGELFLLALAAYGAIMWKVKSTTIGGIVCGLRVVRQDGRDMSWDTTVIRALACFLSLVVAGLGFLWIAFDPEKQAWHDKIAGTLVVVAPKGQPLI